METRRDQPPQHALCLPFPSQGHINPMLKLATLLHHTGFRITFVNTEYNHRRLLKSRGPDYLDALPGFRYETIPDGLATADDTAEKTQDVVELCHSAPKSSLDPLRELIKNLNDSGPKVTCVITDVIMTFALDAAIEAGVPGFLFRTANATSLMCYKHVGKLIEKGLIPLKDESYLTNGYLDDTIIDWLPAMPAIRLRDFPTFIWTTDPNDKMLKFCITEPAKASKSSGIIINSFDSLEFDVLSALKSMGGPPFYTIGPLHLLTNLLPENGYESVGSNLWKEEAECIQWLNTREADSVIYVNFGSITVLTPEQLLEFAWGLANSSKSFLWIIRPDLVVGDEAILPPDFVNETKERGMISGWCPQEQVLKHPSIAGFLTHCGWNSMLESLSFGVPMICWPFFADQTINCRCARSEWGVGMEINVNVKRDEVENLVRELMDGEKGKEMKRKALDWKRKAEEATGINGSSVLNFENLIKHINQLSKLEHIDSDSCINLPNQSSRNNG